MEWHVESKEFPIILDERSQEVTRMPFTEQGRRDARLAAAAPELLALVQEAHEGLSTGWIENESHNATVRRRKLEANIKDVITKALAPSCGLMIQYQHEGLQRMPHIVPANSI